MNIQAEKKQLLQWVEALNDPDILKDLKAFKKSTEEGWWDMVSAAEKAAIEEGISQLNSGLGIPHEAVMQELKSKFGL